jgi:UDP-N-acetylglucosamine 2-epimerase (non-hydrolysing)
MAPIIRECRRAAGIEPVVCFTGQHDEMLRQVTDYFGIEPDFDLKLMSPGQSLAELTARCLTALDDVISRCKPTCIVAQGDTTSVLAASLAAFYRRVPFVHVEAGLRTGDLQAPWPEEMNRRVASVVTALHCAPTERAAACLRREGFSDDCIRVTGNTVIDALLWTLDRERARASHWKQRHAYLDGQPMVLITAHRRENHGAGLANIFRTLAALARQHARVSFVFPVHLNPEVQAAANSALAGIGNVHLHPPLAYPEFVWLMDRSSLIVSDSGGVQEEAPSLRKPVVALRDSTERQEALEIGAVELVGSSPERLADAVTRLLSDRQAHAAMQATHNPFGDGRAAERIVQWISERFGAS